MWKYTAEYGERCCSLHDSRITAAQLKDGVLTLYFEEGIMLLPNTRSNDSADTVYRSTAAAVEIDLYDDERHIPQPAEAEIKGGMFLLGRYIGDYSRWISVQALIDDINAHPGKYETLYVYASEGDDWEMLIRGAVHDEWKQRIFRKTDRDFELQIFKKSGTKMRYCWNELNKDWEV